MGTTCTRSYARTRTAVHVLVGRLLTGELDPKNIVQRKGQKLPFSTCKLGSGIVREESVVHDRLDKYARDAGSA